MSDLDNEVIGVFLRSLKLMQEGVGAVPAVAAAVGNSPRVQPKPVKVPAAAAAVSSSVPKRSQARRSRSLKRRVQRAVRRVKRIPYKLKKKVRKIKRVIGGGSVRIRKHSLRRRSGSGAAACGLAR